MHYGAYGFAIDPTVPTIIVPNGVSIGQRAGFSDVIITQLSECYNFLFPSKYSLISLILIHLADWFVQVERPLQVQQITIE